MRVDTIDLRYLGLPRAAAAFLLRPSEAHDRPARHAPTDAVLIECGPAACLERLDASLRSLGVDPTAIRRVLLTHIHLDHAGAAGHLAARGASIAVHPFGAPHLSDPSRLIESSRRVHGDAFDRHYGEPLPIAATQLEPTADGARIDLGFAVATAIETPGHARHHHAWLVDDGRCRRLFAGDVAAMLVPGTTMLSLPTPPPEFDLAAWRTSLVRLRSLRADELWLTHFGRVEHAPVEAFLGEVAQRLEEEVAFAVDLLATTPDEATAIGRYQEFLRSLAQDRGVDAERMRAFLGGPLCRMNLTGIRRWRERGGSL